MFFLLLINLFCAEPDCVRPTLLFPTFNAKVAAPQSHHAPLSESDVALGEFDAILNRWGRASQQQEILLRSQRDNLRLHFSKNLNGHAAIALEKLVGQVEARQLRSQYEWKIIETGDREICLEAIPQDETERLFYHSIRVWLKSSNAHLTRIQATDRQGETSTNWSVPEMTAVVLASLESLEDDGIPPSPYLEKADPGPVRAPTPSTAGPSMAKDRQIRLASARLSLEAIPMSEPTVPVEQSSEVNAILDKWEAASRKVKTSKSQITRTTYNLVFEEERVAKGELTFEAPDKVSLKLRPTGTKHAKSSRMGKKGDPFRILDDRAETMIWDSRQIVLVNDEEKTYEIAQMPKDIESVIGLLFSPIDFKLPFLLEIHAEQLRQDWSFTLSKFTKETIILTAVPRTEAGKIRFSKCFIIVDATTWHTVAVKYFYPAGSVERVYKIESRQINQELAKDWFTPDFKQQGYKLVLQPKDE